MSPSPAQSALGRLDPARLAALGFADADAADTLGAAAAVLALPADSATHGRFAKSVEQLRGRIGRFLTEPARSRSRQLAGSPRTPGEPVPVDVLRLLAYLATVEDVVRFHRSRRVEEATSAATLADLGRNAALHRRTHDEFGLESYRWLEGHWQGSLYQVGRLQYEFEHRRGVDGSDHWLAAVHIPESGPLSETAVQQSLDDFARFAAGAFSELQITELTCESWMLDPQLGDYLPSASNILCFQRRFELTDLAEAAEGSLVATDADIVYFVFRRRERSGAPRLDGLPRQTRLQRAIVDHLAAGGHWHARHGRLR
ncbi:acyltransferase domain-containing protein [Jatrophihabitans telluris]|uniref:Acyltransferase domain-containing protein n=1 Tax=Jatrophihabitans telluris TaxID=2038343 RepID=A0ABY4QWG8_9ACTN|nr:acyltransferase domain-containing protein [Jatrophihabitans telluris]UQX87487.1 acyltransferase domain-containing protein [Jatrophihabitans telluris]